LGEQPGFMSVSNDTDVDFLDDIKNTKGLGEKVMTILFNNNIVTYLEALDKGVKGLVEFAGIGPKKAEGLMELAEEIKERITKQALKLEDKPESQENVIGEEAVYEPEENQKLTAKEKATINKGEDLEDEEIPISDLSDFSQEILDTLKANGFETLAELSVTPLDELVAIDGIDENLGTEILAKVKQQLGNVENV